MTRTGGPRPSHALRQRQLTCQVLRMVLLGTPAGHRRDIIQSQLLSPERAHPAKYTMGGDVLPRTGVCAEQYRDALER